jgi:hypothetical protein
METPHLYQSFYYYASLSKGKSFGKQTTGLFTSNNMKCFSLSAIPHWKHWFRSASHYFMFSIHKNNGVSWKKDQGLDRHLTDCGREVWTRLQMYILPLYFGYNLLFVILMINTVPSYK